MKITVIGTINKDIIIPYQGVPQQSLGGIFYSITTLMNFMKDGEQIIPVSYVGKELSHLIEAFKVKWKQVDFSGLIPLDEHNHQVILEYTSRTEREEKAFFFFPKLKNEHIQKFLDTDFIIANMITGQEMDVDVFKFIAQTCYDKLYLDVHSLLLKTDELGKRVEHRPDDIFEWLNYARFIQLNEKEYEIINSDGMDFKKFWGGLLRPSQNVFLTMGEKGVWWIANRNGVQVRKFPGYEIKNIKEPTGCGDVFGAAFAYSFVKKKVISKAIEFGILAAGASTLITGTENFYMLKDEMKKLNGKLVEAEQG